MEKRDIISESLLEVKKIKSVAQETARVMLEEKITKSVSEAVDKVFEDEEMKDDEPINVDKEDDKSTDEATIPEIYEDNEIGEAKSKSKSEKSKSKSKSKSMIGEKEEIDVKGDDEIELDLDTVKGDDDAVEVPEEEELDEVYRKIMSEVEVGKLPSDVQDVEKETDVKEEEWHEAEPKAKKDFTMKESRTLKRVLNLYKGAIAENNNLRNLVKKLVFEMKEINLFNQKLLKSTKLMSEHSLTDVERRKILANFDSASTTKEVDAVYSAFTNALHMRGRGVNESVTRKMGSMKRSSLNENSRDENKQSDAFARMNELAGTKE